MGRKIPARKHHGVRDPIKQAEQRLALIKHKIDNPPENKDFQKVSHNLANFIKLKEEAKAGTYKRKRLNDDDEDKPENYANNPKGKQPHRNNKTLTDIRRFQNESAEDYLRRVKRITNESIQESKFEAKYGVEVIRNAKSGEISLRKRPQDELEVQNKLALQQSRKKGNKANNDELDVKFTSKERLALAKEMIKKRKKAEIGNTVEEYQRDVVKFGEVAHAPPRLVKPKVGKKCDANPPPGRKKLLLNAVFEHDQGTPLDNDDVVVKQPKAVDLKGKRKDLPMATRQLIEWKQKNAIEAYRQLKKNKRVLS